jgi:hypothetical protein
MFRPGTDDSNAVFPAVVDDETLATRLTALLPPCGTPPDITVVVPVNAQGDLLNVVTLLSDVGTYRGPHTVAVILVVNNFPDGHPPGDVTRYRGLGVEVLAIPDVRRPGEPPGFSARVLGIRAAASDVVVVFDADNRVPDITALLDWYVEQFRRDAQAAYSHVAFYDFEESVSIRVRFALHHGARWVKRTLLGIPTTQGANYAVRRTRIIDLYDRGLLADEMNVGPTFKRLVGRVAYSGDRRASVYTSARMFPPGWRRIIPYYLYRLRYNLRVLPVRAGVAARTGRERDPVRRYENNRPVRQPRPTRAARSGPVR